MATTDSILGDHTAISAIAAVFLFVPFTRVVVRTIFPTTAAMTVVAVSLQRGTSRVVRAKARANHVMYRCRHEHTPIARVVLAFIVTAGDFRLGADTAATTITAVFLSVSPTRGVCE